MDAWKEFEQNPISHSAAHHIVAIKELLDEYGYARVSDVARLLEITRGSVSITLKGLKGRGLVTEDDRRFLGLSKTGEHVARSVIAKKAILKKFFIEALGVEEHQADIDTCKIEHLISSETAERVAQFLRFLDSDDPSSERFRKSLAAFDEPCSGDPSSCPCCVEACLVEELGDDELAGRSNATDEKRGDARDDDAWAEGSSKTAAARSTRRKPATDDERGSP